MRSSLRPSVRLLKMRFRDAAAALWCDLWVPSDDTETPYQWMVIGISHAVLGACLSTMAVALPWWCVATILFVLYFIFKEMKDMKRGGTFYDSLVDTAFVCLGTLYSGHPAWPWLVLSTAVFGGVLRYWRKGYIT